LSRLRATLSTDALDQEIAQAVERARRDFLGILSRCIPGREQDIVRRRRMYATRRDLERILGAMDSVRRVASPYGHTEEEPSPTPKIEKPGTVKKE
jgi:hypothetical protein